MSQSQRQIDTKAKFSNPCANRYAKHCNQFICGLPNIPAFNSLHSELPNHVTSTGDQDLGAFIALTEKALELDTIFHSILLPAGTVTCDRSQPSSPPLAVLPVSAIPPVLPIAATGSATNANTIPYSSKLCTNCGRNGHLFPTCFEPGGGMEGQRAEYKKDRNSVIAMLLADLDASVDSDNLKSSGSAIVSFPTPLISHTLDDHITVPAMANLSVSSTFIAQNDIYHRDLYSLYDIPSDSTSSPPPP
jgi:hypothetical protein